MLREKRFILVNQFPLRLWQDLRFTVKVSAANPKVTAVAVITRRSSRWSRFGANDTLPPGWDGLWSPPLRTTAHPFALSSGQAQGTPRMLLIFIVISLDTGIGGCTLFPRVTLAGVSPKSLPESADIQR